jgi:integrase
MACRVTTNRHGTLTFRIYFDGCEKWKSTGKPDTPENRHEVEALAVIINKGIKERTFSWDWFQDEAKQQKPGQRTVGSYYLEWIQRKKPPTVRAGLANDYKEQFERYIIPRFKNVPLTVTDVTPQRLDEFRAYLLHERGLSLKSCRNIIDGTFRAMVRDWRTEEAFKPKASGGELLPDPFAFLKWPRIQREKPDPFTEEDRDKVLNQFRLKSPFYYPWTYTLFFTGMRPSEALGLRWGDVDLRAGFLSITKSRYKDEEGAPKTAGSERELKLLPTVVNVLKRIKPVHTTESAYVFLNQEGRPLNFHTWRAGVWYRILRGAQVRERKPY